SRPYIANFVRLLTLPEEVQVMLREGSLSAGHGRVLLGLKLKKNIIPPAKKAVAQGLTVRQLEDVVNNLNENVARETIKPARVPIFI
ncbi:chromosome partitioning protein ParB, partial [Listeria monocytogenes]|nr:chromosome partitioning protein ParB [Listeria monocytogenes]